MLGNSEAGMMQTAQSKKVSASSAKCTWEEYLEEVPGMLHL